MGSPIYAVYGAAFNPPHRGHADAMAQLLRRFDGVIAVPSLAHAFGKEMIDFDRRIALLHYLLRDHFPGETRIEVSRVEADILADKGAGPVYSIEVLERLRKHLGARLVLAIGQDNARPEVWQRFYAHERIEREFGKVVVAERLTLHSTEIRERLRGQIFPDRATQDYLARACGKAIAGELIEHNLYCGA
jgi:nicotinate-nucleotide adenylyltransferase